MNRGGPVCEAPASRKRIVVASTRMIRSLTGWDWAGPVCSVVIIVLNCSLSSVAYLPVSFERLTIERLTIVYGLSQESQHVAAELLRLLVKGHVAGAFDDQMLSSRYILGDVSPVLRGYQAVPLAPDDQGGQREAVEDGARHAGGAQYVQALAHGAALEGHPCEGRIHPEEPEGRVGEYAQVTGQAELEGVRACAVHQDELPEAVRDGGRSGHRD